MKLYATTTSERASKGQGGEYLDIEIQNEKKDFLWTIKIREYDLFYKIDIWNNIDHKYSSQQIEKGKQQKGEN